MPTEADSMGAVRRHRPITWVDHATYPLFTWTLGVTMLEVPASLLLALVYGGRRMPDFVWWLLIHPVLLDLCSAYLSATHLVRGGGRHGQALVSWLCYAPVALVGLAVAWWWRLAALAGLTLFHASCQYYLPLYVATRLGWRPKEGEFPYWRGGRPRHQGSGGREPPED